MKRYISMLMSIFLILFCALSNESQTYASAKIEKSRAIAIVFDNSGTMYLGDEDSRKTWCRATYAMQALATMMNSSDVMHIYPMNPIQIGDLDKPKDDDLYTRERPLIIRKENASLIQEICTPNAGDTHIEAVTLAREGLEKTKADEKWLIVLTDGTVFYRNGKELSKQESIRQLTEEFNKSVSQVNAMYLGIGKESQSGFDVKGKYHFVERKALTSAQVLANLTELGNIIFGRDALPSVSENIVFDVSMKKLILFIQGESIDNVALSGLKPSSTDKLKYSTYGAKNYGDRILCDKSLQGTMLIFENLDAGSYKLSFSGQASDIAVYYEPNVDLDFVFTNADGTSIDSKALYEGDYKVSFGMKDAKTGQLISSPLLGNPHYTGSYYINGKEYPISHDGYSGESPISLKMNDTFDANLTATYLSGYTITKNSSDFGWPKGGVRIAARPAGDLKLEITGGDETYSLQTLEEGKPYIAKVYYQGVQLVGSELERVNLKWEAENSNAEIKKEFAGDHWKFYLRYKDSDFPQNTVCGDCIVSINAYYSAKGSNEAQTQDSLTYKIKDDFLPIQVELVVPDDYIVIKDLKDSKAIVAKLTIEGKKLTSEEFSNVKLQADCGSIVHTITPSEVDSLYYIKLLPTEGIDEGNYTIEVTAQITDKFGRILKTDDSALVELSVFSLWVKWLIALLILLILAILIWKILHIKVLPKYMHTTRKTSSMIFDGDDVTQSTNFLAEIKKKNAKVQSQYGGKKFGVSMDVKPGKESYLYKSQKRKTAEVKVASVKKFGSAKIQEVMIGSTKYVAEEAGGKIVPALPNQKPFMLTNGMIVKFSGTIQDAGIDKDFEVTSKINFRKK